MHATSSRPGPTSRRVAIRHSILGQMAGGIMPTLMREGGVASLLIIALTGEESVALIGLAFLIMQWSMLARLFAAPLVDRSWRKRFLQRWLLVSSMASAMLLLGPGLGLMQLSQAGVWVFLVMLAIYFVALQTGVTAWFPLLSYIVPASLRGRYFGNMRRAWQITSFGAVFLSGLLLGRDPDMIDFLIVLTPALLLQFGRAGGGSGSGVKAHTRPDAGTSALRDMLVPLCDHGFMEFVVFTLCVGIMQFAAIPFVVPFLRSALGFPAAITLFGSGCFGLGSVLSVVGWGRMADRRGTRLVFALSGMTASVALVAIAVTPPYATHSVAAGATAMVGMMLAGVGAAGIGIAYTVRLMRMAPAQHSSPYLNLCQSAIGLTAGMAAAGIGAALAWLPDHITVAGNALLTYRGLFVGIAVFLLLVLGGLRRLPLQGEPPLRAALRRKPALLS